MSRFSHTLRTGCGLLLAMLAGTVAAEQIYRSVDAEGNVTFSNQPPANSVTVDQVSVQPGPSDAAQREAQERMQRQEAAANELGEANASREQQKPPAAPAVPEPVQPDEPVNQYYDGPYEYPPHNRIRDRIRDRIDDRLPPRPVQLPAPPVQPSTRPVQPSTRPAMR
jgi:Domain of unknown function (DUF4124)